MNFNYLKYLFAFIVVGINFCSCGLYLDRANHVLFSKPAFISVKTFAPNGVSFAQQFVFDRPALAHDRLNMSAWDGQNEVIWNIPQDWKEISFDADLRAGSYLWIFIITDENKRLGFRLSQNPKFESGFYELSKDKEFLKKQAFEFFDPPGRVHVNLSYREEILRLNVQDRELYKSGTLLPNRLLSFRSSANGVNLDNFSSDTGFNENFSPETQPKNWVIAFLLTVANALLLIIAFRRNKFSDTQSAGVALFITALLVFWVWLDQERLSARYSAISQKNWQLDLRDNPKDVFEIARKRALFLLYSLSGDSRNAFLAEAKDYVTSFFALENTALIPDFAKKIFHPNGLEKNEPWTRRKYVGRDGKLTFVKDYQSLSSEEEAAQRVAFLGSSLTYGGGAHSPEQIYVEQVSRQFASCAKSGFSSLNVSSIGRDGVFFLSEYKEMLKYWQPTLLVVSIELYEMDIENYKRQMESLIKLNLEKGIPVVFIKEAHSPEGPQNLYLQNYQIIEEFARKYGLQVLDMNSYMDRADIYDSGILWLDSAHLDQAGHNRAAQWLFSELKERKLAACR